MDKRRRILIYALIATTVLTVVAIILYAQLAVPEHPSAIHTNTEASG